MSASAQAIAGVAKRIERGMNLRGRTGGRDVSGSREKRAAAIPRPTSSDSNVNDTLARELVRRKGVLPATLVWVNLAPGIGCRGAQPAAGPSAPRAGRS